MSTCPAHSYRLILPKISDAIFKTVKERYYKVTAESLRVCTEIVKLIRGHPDDDIDSIYDPIIQTLVENTMERLVTQDLDQEVKECAILCIAQTVATLGDQIRDKAKFSLV